MAKGHFRRGRGTCPVCSRELTTTVGGLMMRHNGSATFGTVCPGSGREASRG